MNVLLDTCVISELVKPIPNEKVTVWVSSLSEETVYLSAITMGEIQKGISKLPDSDERDRLQHWLETDLISRFENRIVPVDLNVVRMLGKVLAWAERSGRPIPAVDGLIAATGLAFDLTVATRNVFDMDVEGLSVFNPWG